MRKLIVFGFEGATEFNAWSASGSAIKFKTITGKGETGKIDWNKFEGSSQPPGWAAWWRGLGPQATRIDALIFDAWEEGTNLNRNRLTADEHRNFVMQAFNLATSGLDSTEITKEHLVDWVQNGKGTLTNTLGDQFKTALTRAKSSYKDQFGEGGLQGFFSAEDFEKRFIEKYKEFNGEELGVITSDILARATGEFNSAVDDGTIDPETGIAFDGSEAGPGGDFKKQVTDMANNLGFKLPDAGIDHFAELLRKKELDALQALNSVAPSNPNTINLRMYSSFTSTVTL